MINGKTAKDFIDNANIDKETAYDALIQLITQLARMQYYKELSDRGCIKEAENFKMFGLPVIKENTITVRPGEVIKFGSVDEYKVGLL